jgi:hypothetical protein
MYFLWAVIRLLVCGALLVAAPEFSWTGQVSCLILAGMLWYGLPTGTACDRAA